MLGNWMFDCVKKMKSRHDRIFKYRPGKFERRIFNGFLAGIITSVGLLVTWPHKSSISFIGFLFQASIITLVITFLMPDFKDIWKSIKTR